MLLFKKFILFTFMVKITRDRSLSNVCQKFSARLQTVSIQIVLLAESFRALRTLKAPSMMVFGSLMSAQIRTIGKLFCTTSNRTFKRFFAGMQSHVSAKHPRPFKLFRTNRTFVGATIASGLFSRRIICLITFN